MTRKNQSPTIEQTIAKNKKRRQRSTPVAQALAAKAAARYFAALIRGGILSDALDINLVNHACEIQDALGRGDTDNHREASALQAGYCSAWRWADGCRSR